MSDNIVSFPKNKIVRDVPPEMAEEIAKKKEKSRQNYADNMVEEITAGLYIELENFGLDSSELHFQKDFIFLAAAIRAIVYRNMGIEHALHKIIDNTVHVRTLPMTATPDEVATLIKKMIDEYGNAEESVPLPENLEKFLEDVEDDQE